MSHQQEQALSEHENGTDTELDESQYELDPVFLNSKREAIVIVAIFLAFGAFCIPVSYWLSQNDPSSTTLGIPSWVFWGTLFPWILANVVTWCFCYLYMVDDPLEDPGAIEDANEVSSNADSIETGKEEQA